MRNALAQLAVFSLCRWPQIFVNFMATLDALNLELFSIYPAECIARGRLGYYYELLATILLPFIAAMGAFVLTLMMRWAAGKFYFFPRARRCCPGWLSWRLQNNVQGWAGLMHSWNHPRMYKFLTWVRLSRQILHSSQVASIESLTIYVLVFVVLTGFLNHVPQRLTQVTRNLRLRARGCR